MKKYSIGLFALSAVFFAYSGFAEQPCSKWHEGEASCTIDSTMGVKTAECNGLNTMISGDHDNCGACGHKCSDSEVCADSKCESCPTGFKGDQNRCMCPPQNIVNGKCMDFQRDNNNCGKSGVVCGHNKYCYKGSCIDTPGRYPFCPAKWCAATCNDGWVVRDLCEPGCSSKCDNACKDHGGCKDTCSRVNLGQFDKECAPNLEH